MGMRKSAADKGALPLVLLPGTLCDARVFGPLRERLASVETRVMPTLEARSLREAAEDVLTRAPEHFALLGFSLGGLVAMETALCAPNRVRRLALLSTTPLAVTPERHGARWAAVEEARTMGLRRCVRERLWPEYCESMECRSLLPLLEDMAETLGHAVFARQTGMALAREDFRARLATLRCPSLVLAGAEDRMCPPAVQRELAAVLADCTHVMLPEAGHLALLEQPDETAAAVAAWFHDAKSGQKRI